MSLPNSPDADKSADASARKKTRRPLNQSLVFWIIVLLIVAILGIIHVHHLGSGKHENAAKPVSVVLAEVKTSDVPVYLTALGSVKPIYTVTVLTQINGILMNVLFKEGQLVKKGDLLAEIDERPFLAQLEQYEGQLIRDKALLANALIDLQRYKTLWRQDSISQQTYATQQSLVQQYQGAIQIDLGLIQATKINLIYCKITSPVDGRIGLRLVDPGNFVQTSNANGIAVITTLDPISVIFTIPEDNIQEILGKIYAGQMFSVQAFDRQQNELLAKGNLLTIDNQIDPTTGMVRLKAIFQNGDNRLFASQFVNIRLLVKTLSNAIVVPTAAIQFGAKGTFVYVLNPALELQPTAEKTDKTPQTKETGLLPTVSVQSVVVGVTSGDNTTITSGLKPGQSVVIEGADNLTNGAIVKVADANHSSAATLAGMINDKQRVTI